jgi:hypothetical protein
MASRRWPTRDFRRWGGADPRCGASLGERGADHPRHRGGAGAWRWPFPCCRWPIPSPNSMRQAGCRRTRPQCPARVQTPQAFRFGLIHRRIRWRRGRGARFHRRCRHRPLGGPPRQHLCRLPARLQADDAGGCEPRHGCHDRRALTDIRRPPAMMSMPSARATTSCSAASQIPHDRGVVGHSDADVLLHALTDALLGCIADGDIGVHFPPSDMRWKGCGEPGVPGRGGAPRPCAGRGDPPPRRHGGLRSAARRPAPRCDPRDHCRNRRHRPRPRRHQGDDLGKAWGSPAGARASPRSPPPPSPCRQGRMTMTRTKH